ncbi:MAG TPA: ThuA domain-containing protein [Opitutaceae bacterium]|nr:ThuA domain-containing protein [Opitutaceae bacterium]
MSHIENSRTALILAGGWEGHQPEACAAMLRTELSKRGFEVVVKTDLGVLDDGASLQQHAVIIPLWTMGALSDAQEANLTAAIRSGVGLAGFHGGMGDAFRGRVEYQWMVGGIFAAHPDNIIPYRVEIVKPHDPVVAGIDDFDVQTEQYYMLVDPAVEVLAQTTFGARESAPWVEGSIMPVAWKKRHGAGRVFYLALGHHAEDFVNVPQQLEILLRGIGWAARLA